MTPVPVEIDFPSPDPGRRSVSTLREEEGGVPTLEVHEEHFRCPREFLNGVPDPRGLGSQDLLNLGVCEVERHRIRRRNVLSGFLEWGVGF